MLCKSSTLKKHFRAVVRAFFISNTFTSNARLKLAKILAKAKQNLEAELLQFENYSLSSFTFSSKNNEILKNVQKTSAVLNRLRPRHGHEYTKYKMCLNIMMVICIKQHLSNIEAQFMKKLKNSVAYKQKRLDYFRI